MAEEDIDIDIDIDGDELEQPQIAKVDNSIGESTNARISDLSILSDSDQLHGKAIDGGSAASGSGTTSKNAVAIETETSMTDDFQIPDWVMQEYHAQAGFETGDMDEKSRQIIESMLAEEEFYSGRPSKKAFHTSIKQTTSSSGSKLAHMRSKGNARSQSKESADPSWGNDGHARLNAISSADLPSHNTRWTSDEDERLREGIRLHGYGNWKAIAGVVATRNPLQVKNHARHLSVSERVPHDVSANTSDGEGLDRRSSAANSADEAVANSNLFKRRHPRSKRIRMINTSGRNEVDFEHYEERVRRARSVTSESGNDDFTGSEFGATSGYDTDNDDDARSMTKSPSLSAKGGSRSGSIGLGTPSPGLRPLFSSSSLSSPCTLTSQRTGISSMDEDEDVDVEIESTDEDALNRLTLSRNLRPYGHNSKSRSISPFSNSSTRSRLSSEFDSHSDRDLDDDDMDEVVESGSVQKRLSAASPALSDNLALSGDLYSNPTFNTSGSSINSVGAAGSFKPLLKDTLFHLQQQQQQQQHKGGTLSHISLDKIVNSPKERRTVSFGAVHVAELQPDINSYDEDDAYSSESEEGRSARKRGLSTPESSFVHSSTDVTLQAGLSPPINLNGIDQALTGNTVIPSGHRNGSGYKINPKRAQTNHESEEDGCEEEEGSLGTGSKKIAYPTSILNLSRKGQKKLPKSKSASTLSVPLAQTVDSGTSASRQQFSHGQLSITPAMTITSAAITLPGTSPSAIPRFLDKSIITEEEMRVHSEFFCNKASKTPERYQRIRNTIIQAWEKSPSTYLTKTSVRSALKDCGDVNAIGRVHSWLESIGVINVGMTASSPGASLARPRNGGNNSSKKRRQSEDRGWSSSSSSSAPRRKNNLTSLNILDDMDSVWVTTPLRRRRVRNERGEWVNESDLEGHVIEHNVHSTKEEKSHSSSRKSNRHSIDIFQLDDEAFFERHGMTKEEMEEELEQERLAAQNAKYFAASELPPVNNRVPKHMRAGHLIQQLNRSYFHADDDEDDGDIGAYLNDDGSNEGARNRLLWTSILISQKQSTGLQCEMDPESDVEARFFFSSKGFVVVGWYHSHPTFEPNPSIRDIENQSEHQSMFRRHELDVEPFVGVIVSPFDPRNLSFQSKFQFLSVSEQVDTQLNCRIPFSYDREITRTNELSVSVFQQLSDLVRYYRTYEHRVDLSLPLRKGETTTRLDKLLKSISHHIFVDETNAKGFLSKVRELVIRGFQLDLPLLTGSSQITSSQISTSNAVPMTTLAGPPLRSTTPTATATSATISQSNVSTSNTTEEVQDVVSSTIKTPSDYYTPNEDATQDIDIDRTPSPQL
ncbi:Myb-like, SWIRM and MPN domains 1 [Linnemannia zychae]|nr:Myb-like, SWIRM and MPN domains 1 [Linnemannia zychae]